MQSVIWCLALVAQALLLLTPGLWRARLPWFRVWLLTDFGVSLFEYLIRGNGPLYSAFWQISFPVLLALLIAACYEAVAHVRGIKWPVIAVAAIAIHVLLSLPHQWRDSSIETVESLAAGWSLVCGLAISPVWRQCRVPDQALILALYCLGKSVCYYSAPAFPKTIGRGIVGVSLVAMACWVGVFAMSGRKTHNRVAL